MASFCGIALLIDSAFSQLTKNAWSRRTIAAVAAAVFSLYCCIASISEIHDYKETTANDQKAVAAIGDRITDDGYLDTGVNIGILNLDASYLEEQNYYYHEHIHGVTESNWCLADAVECYLGGHRPTISPLPSEQIYVPWNCEERRLGKFNVLYLYNYNDGTLTQVSIESIGEESYELYGEDGSYLGYTWEEDNCGYMVLNNSLT